MSRRGWSEGELSRRSGVHQPTIHRIITGESKNPRRENIQRLAKALGVPSEWLWTGDPGVKRLVLPVSAPRQTPEEPSAPALPDRDIHIPEYDVRAAMGAGQMLPSDYVDTVRHITVAPDYLRQLGVHYTASGNLAVVTGFGESMAGTFSSGDALIIDQGVKELSVDGIYLFTLAGMLYIKRLQRLPGMVRMISDNDAFPAYDIKGAELESMIIHARVLLAWNARKL